jgi:membrane-associated protease RseP (regulator of RpoE activity)
MPFPLAAAIALFFWGGSVLDVHAAVDGPKCCDRGGAKVICIQAVKAQPGPVVLQAAPQTGRGTADEQRHVIVRRVAPGEQVTPPAARKGGKAQDGGEEAEIQQVPAQWIGVRVSPVPEPLAAHIGAGGVMIANIAKGSPADQVGLQRYDVIVAFDGQKIDNPNDLMQAVGGVKAGTETEMTLVRSGQKQKLSVKPAERPAGSVEFKYEEPQEDVVDRSMELRGLRLQPGPGGEWIIEQLGPLQTVPDILRELEKKGLPGLRGPLFDQDFDIDIDIDEMDDSPTAPPGAEKGQVRVEVKVQVDENGRTTIIHRDADGKIHVERTDKDGNKSSATYENSEEFQKQDPDGFRMYQRSSGHRGRSYLRVWPRADQLQRLRQKFQGRVEEQLQEALRRAKDAEKAGAEAVKKYREQMERIYGEHRGGGSGQGGAHDSESISVSVHDAGKITITTEKNGQRKTYEFDSKEEFRTSEPKLYEEVKGLFE